ncbi:hypothetical protein P4H94_26895 [Paenibacillus macerans]|uniref:Uncharacterized protein n=1 Tax=Paenibacillus macerans TaxID=44252 RepID=A0A090ZNK6_PAEMA|nr:hypothetical protein [Paenibacillus macerans]KFN12177.1 hypothetical protein DJ90_2029 [Paenibacillus macerans]MBS5913510.1 hypothetical protein [Paenibacillus macerans]MCY7558477.1 hypothetical protein [Paenibacillus macerans]MEC0140475.1 hypothetical protein [Paenibacillus macerans]MEC0150243.1 hypothetical protein [Paenibacillus macerans]
MNLLWNNRSGSGYPFAVTVVLFIMLLSCGIFEYFRLTIIAAQVRGTTQSAIIAVATENYSHIYSSLRQSYSGAFSRSGNEWRELWSAGDINGRIRRDLGLMQEGTAYVRKSSDRIEYSISGLDVKILNSPFAPASPGSARQFTAEAKIHLTVPLSFGWGHLPPMQADLNVQAVYRPRF